MSIPIYSLGTPPEDDYPAIDWALRTNARAAERLLEIDAAIRACGELGPPPRFYFRGLPPDLLQVVPGIAISSRARMAIEALGVHGLHFLSCVVASHQFFILYTSRVIDCLDVERSDIEYFRSSPNRVKNIHTYVFARAPLADLDVFTLPQQANGMFVWSHPLFFTEQAMAGLLAATLRTPSFSLAGTAA